MKSKITVLALAITASFASQAAVITLDDFTLSQAVNVSNSPLTVGAGTNFTSREVTLTSAASNSFNPNVIIGTNSVNGVTGNYLQISGSNGSAYTTSITWNFNAIVLAALANATWSIDMNQVFVDETVTVGGNMRTSANTGTTVNLGSGSGTGTLNPFSVTFNAAINSDSTWSLLQATYNCNQGFTLTEGGTCASTSVPEPGTIALLGLGLLGAGALRRKAK